MARNPQIDLCGLAVGMPEQCLNHAEVDAKIRAFIAARSEAAFSSRTLAKQLLRTGTMRKANPPLRFAAGGRNGRDNSDI